MYFHDFNMNVADAEKLNICIFKQFLENQANIQTYIYYW